jgi:hypothetical protein
MRQDTSGFFRKKMAGNSTSAKRMAAIISGGSMSRPQRTTTKLVPQTGPS